MFTAKLKSLLSHIILFSMLITNLCYADSLDTQLSRDRIDSGDTFTVSFILKSTSNRTTPDFSPFEKDFQILSNNYGNSISIINGTMTTQSYWQLTLLPKRTGELLIPEIDFGNVKSAARKLTVSDISNSVVSNQQESSVFVEADVNNTSPYTQSQVVYTFKLFYQSQLENPVVEVPQTKDATFIQLGDGTQYETTIKGKPYVVIEKKFALFPHNAGKLVIPPARFRALSYDMNSNISYGPFSINEPKRLLLSTKAFKLNVKSIPEQFQGTTWLPAKNIALTEKWSDDSRVWEAGNPVTRTIAVQATGLRADQIPDLKIDKVDGMNVYVDPPKRSNNIQGDSLTGVLEQQITYIPNTSSSFTIPPIKLQWWDTRKNIATSTQLNAMTIQIKGKNTNTGSPSHSQTIKAISNTTPHQAPDTSASEKQTNAEIVSLPFYYSIWFWVAMLSFLIWFITIILLRIKKPTTKQAKFNPLKNDDIKLSYSHPEFSDANFKKACKNGDAASAKQLLLSWAKKIWSDEVLNLEKLSQIINDHSFSIIINDLEQAVYANHGNVWNGQDLLSSYEKLKKQHKFKTSHFTKNKMTSAAQQEPLPPLNP